MGRKWVIDSDSLWVIAPASAVTGHEGARVLTESSSVVKRATTHGTGVLLFTDTDLAERYISAAGLEGFEPARFDDVPALLQFILDMAHEKVACFAVDHTLDNYNASLTTLKDFAKSICKAVEESPDDPD